MPRKIRDIKKDLIRAGFDYRSGKGSHQIWNHPFLPAIRIVIARNDGEDGEDAPLYLEKQVKEALQQLRERGNG